MKTDLKLLFGRPSFVLFILFGLWISGFETFAIAQDKVPSFTTLIGSCAPGNLNAQGHWDCLSSNKKLLCVAEHSVEVDIEIKRLASSAAPIEALEALVKTKVEQIGLRNLADWLACQGFHIQTINKRAENATNSELILGRVEASVSLLTGSDSNFSRELRSWKVVKEKRGGCWLWILCEPPIEFVLIIDLTSTGSVNSVYSGFSFNDL